MKLDEQGVGRWSRFSLKSELFPTIAFLGFLQKDHFLLFLTLSSVLVPFAWLLPPPAEFPGEGGGDVLQSGPEHRGGDVQQRDGRSRPGGVPTTVGGDGSPQGLHQVQSPAGYQK